MGRKKKADCTREEWEEEMAADRAGHARRKKEADEAKERLRQQILEKKRLRQREVRSKARQAAVSCLLVVVVVVVVSRILSSCIRRPNRRIAKIISCFLVSSSYLLYLLFSLCSLDNLSSCSFFMIGNVVVVVG